MLNKQFGLAIAATLLAAASLSSVQGSFCRVISTDSRVLYLFAEYKMLTGDKEAAVKLLQEASVHKDKSPVRRDTCSEAGPGAMVVMY